MTSIPSMADPRNVVRLATPADADQLLDICRIAHKEHEWHCFPFSEDLVRAEIEVSIDVQQQEGMIGVIGNDIVEGMAWLYYGQADWYTEVRSLSERLVCVHPSFRRGNYHIRNLLAWVHTAEESIGPLVVGVISNNRTAAKVRLYRRRFGEPSGVITFWARGNAGKGR